MNTLLQDIRYALRQLCKSPGFALTVIVTLALGIGANTAIFTLVHGILLRALPVANPAQLYRIGDTDDCCVEGGFQNDNGDYAIFSYDAYLHLKNSAPEFEQLAAVRAGRLLWSVRRGESQAKSLHGQFVSGNFFSTLGLGAYAGRVFGEGDDTPSATPATVVSYRAWQTEFASDPSIVGSTIFIEASLSPLLALRRRASLGIASVTRRLTSGRLCRPNPILMVQPPYCITRTLRGFIRWAGCVPEPTSAFYKRSSPPHCGSGWRRVQVSRQPRSQSSMWSSRPAAAASRTCNRSRARH